MKELTVHHKDHNHDNNPPDGSNWELLVPLLPRPRAREERHGRTGGGSTLDPPAASTLFNPFGALDNLVKSPEP